ncbi:MAG: phenylalanine--tRNA ligase subunit beta [Oligoflexales bacterium]
MLISLNWLSKYVDIAGIDPTKIADSLTRVGIEVEKIEKTEPVKGELLVGKVLTAKQHPNADKLRVCTVDVGRGDPLNIVCGAPNAREGIFVAVALEGSELPGNFKIKASTIRGEPSQGMLCSEKELEISDNHEGIIELSTKTAGADAKTALHLNDTVLTLSLTPNRSDCLSYIGIARELSASLGLPLNLPKPTLGGSFGKPTAESLKVRIDDKEDCSRFTALKVENVRPLNSPYWLKQGLRLSGVRPINLIVDATNFVMLEYGHPIHAYDERFLKDKEIFVRRAQQGEKLQTLDEQIRVLDGQDLVITDGTKPIGLAGVMGGADSEIKDDTASIIVEAAHFNPTLVRKTSKKFALHTEASHRFERGIDVTGMQDYVYRVAEIIALGQQEIGFNGPPPIISGQPVDEYLSRPTLARVALRLERAREILGLSTLTQKKCVDRLESIGIKLLDSTQVRMLFEVPSWRQDIEREIDLIEEIGRLEGYDAIPTSIPAMEIASSDREDPYIEFEEDVRQIAAHAGLTEIISFPFVSQTDLTTLNLGKTHPWNACVQLRNPLSEEFCNLIPTTLINLLKSTMNNRFHGKKGCRLFEVATCFYNWKKHTFDPSFSTWSHLKLMGRQIKGKAREDDRPFERRTIGIVLDQPFSEQDWQRPLQPANFYHMKSILGEIFKMLGVRAEVYVTPPANAYPWLNTAASAVIKHGDLVLGYAGELHPLTSKKYGYDLGDEPIVCELDLENIMSAKALLPAFDATQYRFPPVTRDLALLVNDTITHADFEKAIREFKGRKNLERYSIFDVYQGSNMEPGKKSMAYTFSFQSVDRTLTDKEVEKEIADLLSWLEQKLAVKQR